MATRLYNQRRGDSFSFTPAFTPTPTAAWTNDTEVVYHMDPTATAIDDTAFLTRTVPSGAVSGTTCHAIFISPPLQSTHVWDAATCIWTTRCIEALSTQDVFQQFYWGLYSHDGLTRRCTSTLEKGATEWPTTLISRTRTDASPGFSYTNVRGDRLYVEVGWDKDAAISGDISIQYGYSDTSGDLSGDGDTGVQNSWVEFSHDVTFDPEGIVYGTKLLMLMGCGT